MSRWWGVLVEAVKDWWRRDAGRPAAALAFYSLFALAPVLVVAVAAAGWIFGPQAARGEIEAQVTRLVGPDAAEAIQDLLARAWRQSAAGWLSLGSLLISFAGATAAFVELHSGLNAFWDIQPPAGGLLRLLRERLWALALMMGIGLLLVASVAAGAAWVAFWRMLGGGRAAPALLEGANLLLPFALTAVLFALAFKFVPDAAIAWNDVWAGALLGSFLFVLGRSAIGWYLGGGALRSAYGAAGSVVVLLLWVYYSAQIFYFAAAFTAAYARRLGSGLRARHGGFPAAQ